MNNPDKHTRAELAELDAIIVGFEVKPNGIDIH